MGRKKIQIKTIENDRQKTVTFTRRRGGLIKKAHELAVLCECKVVLLMFDSKDECHMYSSEEDPDELIGKYYSKEFHSGDSKKRKLSKLDDDPFTPGLIQEEVNETTPTVNEYKIMTNGDGSENIQVKQVKGVGNNSGINSNGQQCITFEPITTTADDFMVPTTSSQPCSEISTPPNLMNEESTLSYVSQEQHQPNIVAHEPFLNTSSTLESSISSGLISNPEFCFVPAGSYNTMCKTGLTEGDLCGSATTSPSSESPPEMYQLYPPHDSNQIPGHPPNQIINCLEDIPHHSHMDLSNANIPYTNYFPNLDPNAINLWGWPSGIKTDPFNQMISFKGS